MRLVFQCRVTVASLFLFCVARAGEPGPLARALQPLVDAHTLAGAVVLVATPEKIVDVEAVGYADIAAERPMQTNDMFWIASMTKPMTAVALMMLVDEGKVSLDDPVEKYLPAFKGMLVSTPASPAPTAAPNYAEKPAPTNEPATHPFTIRECLWHGAGLKATSALEHPTLDHNTLAERVESYAHEPLARQPGTLSVYANEGSNIAGRIIEVVSGQPYEHFLQQRLFTPLGMIDTTFWPTREQIARLATTYQTSPDKTGLVTGTVTSLTYPLDGPGRYPIPAGGLFSTAQDVAKFCQMIANRGVWEGRRYLSEKSWEEMKTRQSPPGDKAAVGVVWRLNGETIGHSGAYKTNMRIDLAKKFITVFLVQQDGDWPTGTKDPNGLFEQAAEQTFLPNAGPESAAPEAPDPSRSAPH